MGKLIKSQLSLVALVAAFGSGQLAFAQSTDEESDSLEEIVVVGQRSSMAAAADIKRNSDQVVEAIVASDIGKFPDRTVAAALQRVPGVQVVNGFNNEIVNPLIRGIGDILTTVNGREVFTGVGRGFAFQDLPAESLAAATVYKSNTANLIEGGIAGVIDLKTHKPFNFESGLTAAGTLRSIYAEEAGELNYTAGGLLSYWSETDAGDMGFLVNASYSDQDFNRPISFICDPRSGSNGPPGAAGTVLGTCAGGLNDVGDYQRSQFSAVFEWRVSDSLEFYTDVMYAGYRAEFETDFIFSDVFAAQNITNVVNSDNCYSNRVMGAGFLGGPNDPIQALCDGASATFNNVPGLTSTQAKTAETDQYIYGGGVRYDSGPLHLDFDLSFVDSENSNRNLIVDIGKQIASVDIINNDGGHGTTNMPGNPLGDATDFRFANGLFQDINQAESSMVAAAMDGGLELDGAFTELQFGLRYADRDADFRAIAPGGPGAPGGNRVTLVDSVGLPSNFLVVSRASIPVINGGAHWMTPNADYIRNNIDELRVLYGAAPGDPGFDPVRNFDADEQTLSGYLQGRYEFSAGDVLIDGLIGARVTKTDRSLSGTGVVDGVPTPQTADTSETDVLPNASMRFQLSPEWQLRLTAAKTIAQPFFGDLNPGLFYNVPINANIQPFGSGGNPNLKPQKSTAYDATAEYYFGDSSYLALAVYYRDITDRVGNAVNPEVIDGITYNISRPSNVGSASLQGFEIGGQIFFDSLPGFWSGFGAFGNYTFADSSIDTPGDALEGFPLLGVSENSYNIGLLYEEHGLTGRLVYTWRDDYDEFRFGCLLGAHAEGSYCGDPGGTPAFNKVDAYGRLDFSLGYAVNDNISVSLDATNITGSDYFSTFNRPNFPHDIRVDDTTVGLTIGARF